MDYPQRTILEIKAAHDNSTFLAIVIGYVDELPSENATVLNDENKMILLSQRYIELFPLDYDGYASFMKMHGLSKHNENFFINTNLAAKWYKPFLFQYGEILKRRGTETEELYTMDNIDYIGSRGAIGQDKQRGEYREKGYRFRLFRYYDEELKPRRDTKPIVINRKELHQNFELWE